MRFAGIVGCLILFVTTAYGQAPTTNTSPQLVSGPIKDVTYQVIWLIESDDANRAVYEGPASKGLENAGYGRLVTAGSATAAVTIGQQSSVAGNSRYGQLTVLTSFLNTTETGELQIKLQFRVQNQSPLSIDSTMRAPMGRWFLIGSADSRAGLPKHTADGKRGVAIMKITDGVLVLEEGDPIQSQQ